MGVAHDLFHPVDGWSDARLDALPTGERIEVLRGNLFVSPQPHPRHNNIVRVLTGVLCETAPDGLWAYPGTELRFGPQTDRSALAPDVLVAPDTYLEADAHPWVSAEEVRLVVEVVSRGSLRADRFTKPDDYAGLGIPCYWRVEAFRSEPVLLEHHLAVTEGGQRTYVETQRSVGGFSTDRPWPITIDLGRLVRRH